MVVDDALLYREDKAFNNTKKELVEENNLYAVISLPQGVFTSVGTNSKTSLLFFEKGKITKDIWYYELSGKFTKSKPVRDDDLEDCWKKFQKKELSDNSWLVNIKELKNFDISAENPKSRSSIEYLSPEQLIENILKNEKEFLKLTNEIKSYLD